jgi:hypothetical protein
MADAPRIQLVIAFHHRRRGKLEASLDLPLPEKPPKPAPVNVACQAAMVKNFMTANPDETCLSAAAKLNINRRRIAKLIKIIDTLPQHFIEKISNCNNRSLLHRLNANHLFYIAGLSTEAERLRELSRIKFNPESEQPSDHNQPQNHCPQN